MLSSAQITPTPTPAPAAIAEAAKTPPPAPSLEQRIAGLEAAIGNGDPTASLKDAKGAIPDGLTTPTVGVAADAAVGPTRQASLSLFLACRPSLLGCSEVRPLRAPS